MGYRRVSFILWGLCRLGKSSKGSGRCWCRGKTRGEGSVVLCGWDILGGRGGGVYLRYDFMG